MDGRPIETTTLREDVETDGRHAKVAFGRDFAADARRRDFTINALSLEPRRPVHDPVGGLDDLAAGRVRFIGEADARIREDYLRILRFFRFSARFGEGRLDAEGLARRDPQPARDSRGCRARGCARKCSSSSSRPMRARFFGRWARAGFCEQALGFACTGRFNRAVAIELARGAKADALLRLAALAAMIPEDAGAPPRRLRLANAEYDRIAQAAEALTGMHGIGARRRQDHLRVLLFLGGAAGRARRAHSRRKPIWALVRTIRASRAATVSSARRRRRSFPSAEATSSSAASKRARGWAKSSGLLAAVDRSRFSRRPG